MSTTLTTASTRMMRSDVNIALPRDTRLRVITITGSDTLQEYIGEIGTVVSHVGGTQPLVKFDTRRNGDDKWYVTAWQTLPNPNQRVVVTECQQYASEGFKDFATGREVTYLSTDANGVHLIQFDGDVDPDYPNPASVIHLDFALGEPVTASEPAPVLTVDTAPSIERRDREARRLYDTLVEAINDMAEREEWCGQFEVWAEENGVEVRRTQERTYSVTIDLTYEIDSDSAASWLNRNMGGSHDEVDASSATLTSTVYVSMTLSNGDDPSGCDSYLVDNALSEAGYSGYSDYDVQSYDED